MNISFHPKNETFIQEQLQSGRYTDADEVVNEAVSFFRLLQERKQYAVETVKQIEIGTDQVANGQKLDGDRSRLSLEEMRKMIGTDKPA